MYNYSEITQANTLEIQGIVNYQEFGIFRLKVKSQIMNL